MRRGLRLLGRAISEQRGIFTIALSSSALFGAMTVANAFVLGELTGRVVLPSLRDGDVATGTLVLAALVILGVAVLKIVGILGRRIGAGVMQYRLQASYRRQVSRQYLRLPLSWHNRHPTGQLLSNANSDVEASWYPIAPLPFACGAILMLVITAVALVLIDPVLALIGLVVFPTIFAINIVYSRVMSPRVSRAQQLRAEVSGIAHESFDGALVVKTLGREAEETERFRERAEELRDSLIAVGKVRGTFDPMMEALPALGTLAVLLFGTMRLESGAIDAGDLVSVAYLFTVLALPIRAIGWVLGDLPRALAGWDRVSAVLSATGEQKHGEGRLPSAATPAHLHATDVTFTYADADEAVLSRITLDITPGRTVALVGPTGSGKSTLVSLFVRLVDPDSGQILVDGADIGRLREGELSTAAAVVAQATFLFDDTVRQNVSLGDETDPVYGDAEIWRALKLAQADRFVRALPDGLETRIGERGTTLSGGQRQRLALARALVRRPRLLILDDATSSVDPAVEAAILGGLRAADLASSVLVVAYRRATIMLADEVVYVEHGRILARGTHDELLDSVPGYTALIRAYSDAAEQRRLESASAGRDEGAA
ncbi:MAG: ABC transporter ATP-binding protein [Geodermatophilaceae bacterium]|nr:ABC transporter ATP-binding protein [Geodermatophilaceae bacterium]